MATARPIGNYDNGYTAPPEWWGAIPDTITISVEQIEEIFRVMGLEPVDVETFIAAATGKRMWWLAQPA